MSQMNIINLDKVDKKENRKAYRRYLKLMRKHTRSIVKQVKKASPFDYDALFIFVSFLRFMREFYTKGDNVWAIEEPGHERAAKLTEALTYFDLWNDYEMDHYEEFQRANDHLHSEADRSARVHDYFIKEAEEKEKYWNKFWEIIRDEFLYWLD